MRAIVMIVSMFTGGTGKGFEVCWFPRRSRET
jgi:hypothetical protein